jgi:hypothetical protein
MISYAHTLAPFLNKIYNKQITIMETMNKYNNKSNWERNMFSLAYSTFIVLLIFTFVVSCIYIGVNSYLSR